MIPHITKFLFLPAYLLSSVVLAAPETRFNTVYYMVGGNTAEDIWADIMAKTPVHQNGKQHVAYTKWHVNWRFWWLDKGESCDISKVTTKLDVTYTLPRLKQTSTMPEPVITRWEEYYAALFEHEQGHKDLGVKAAIEVENEISNMGPKSSCDQLELDANKIGKNVINKYSRIEKEYDRSTNHGLNSGAVFP